MRWSGEVGGDWETGGSWRSQGKREIREGKRCHCWPVWRLWRCRWVSPPETAVPLGRTACIKWWRKKWRRSRVNTRRGSSWHVLRFPRHMSVWWEESQGGLEEDDIEVKPLWTRRLGGVPKHSVTHVSFFTDAHPTLTRPLFLLQVAGIWPL